MTEVHIEWTTPAGNPRRFPMYSATVENVYLGKHRVIKGKDRADVKERAQEQRGKWAGLEAKKRVVEGKRDAKERAREQCEAADLAAKDELSALGSLLAATLDVDDRIDWNEIIDNGSPDPFAFVEPKPVSADTSVRPTEVAYADHPKRPWYASFWPGAERRWQEACTAVDDGNARLHAEAQAAHAAEVERCRQVRLNNELCAAEWANRLAVARQAYEVESDAFYATQRAHNESVAKFKAAFERGVPEAVTEYLSGVFERSDYPTSFNPVHSVAYDGNEKSATVTIDLPDQAAFPDVTGYKFVASKSETRPVRLRKREHTELYERAIAQCILRTVHEVFESDYAAVISEVNVSAFTSRIDPATGKTNRSCRLSVSASRPQFEGFDLARLDPIACVESISHSTMSSM